jgi:hypothetical protein
MIDASPAQDLLDGMPSLDASAWTDARATAKAIRAAQARQVSGRRRLVDPTTCDRDYSAAEVEFMHAMERYKARSGRMFPTWSEVLEVLRELGYQKPQGILAAFPASPEVIETKASRVAQAC